MKQNRLRLRLLLLTALLLPATGCTAATLAFMFEKVCPGRFAGIRDEGDGGCSVVYLVDGHPRVRDGYYAFRVPGDWTALGRRGLGRPRGGGLAALARKIECTPYGGSPSPGELDVPARLLAYDEPGMLFPMGAPPPPGLQNFGLLQLTSPGGTLVHEVYGLDRKAGRWVRLGSVDLGAPTISGERVLAGLAFLPVALVIDTGIVLAIAKGGGGGFHIGGGGSSGPLIPKPVPMEVRGLAEEGTAAPPSAGGGGEQKTGP